MAGEMNLTNEEAHINRRVAVALGYSVQEHQRGNRSGFRVMRHEIPQGITLWARESGAWSGIPDFCRDPAAADLVRQEIERRGWDWWVYRFDGVYHSDVTVPIEGGKQEYTRDSHQFPHHALCLAFLAAHEVTKAEEGA